jgi:hypothetical protein
VPEDKVADLNESDIVADVAALLDDSEPVNDVFYNGTYEGDRLIIEISGYESNATRIFECSLREIYTAPST